MQVVNKSASGRLLRRGVRWWQDGENVRHTNLEMPKADHTNRYAAEVGAGGERPAGIPSTPTTKRDSSKTRALSVVNT